MLNNLARVQSTEEKVCLVFAAATVTTVEGPVKLPVVHHLAVHAQLQTDALASPNIPAENLVRSDLPGDHSLDSPTCSTPAEPSSTVWL